MSNLSSSDSSRADELHRNRLSQWETIGQSLASIAPTATPAMVVPLVLAASGKASWLAYLLATLGVACIAQGINVFTRGSSSSGSLYAYVQETLGKWPSLVAAWALLIAYIGTAAAVTGGLTNYAWSLLHVGTELQPIDSVWLTAIAVALAGVLAYRDVQLSARLMLWFEAVSILLIVVLFLYPGPKSAWHLDLSQLQMRGLQMREVRGGLVLAIFSFVGFESATTLGQEAKDPLCSIPRAVTLTALLSGFLFIFSAYAENVGFGSQVGALQDSGAPLQLLAQLRGLSFLAPLLAIGSIVSFFACTLACITAAARILFTMSRDGHLHVLFGRAHATNRTPHTAVVLAALVSLVVPVTLAARHASPFDIYGWVGTIATYGFLTAYLLVTVAALLHDRERSHTLRTLGFRAGALAVLGLAGWSAFDPSATGAYRWLPYLYLSLLAAGVLISVLTGGIGSDAEPRAAANSNRRTSLSSSTARKDPA